MSDELSVHAGKKIVIYSLFFYSNYLLYNFASWNFYFFVVKIYKLFGSEVEYH